MVKKTPPEATPSAAQAKIQNAVEKDSFEELLKHFNASTCDADAFVVAAHMYTRFPAESRKLLPLIKDEQLGYDGKTNAPGTNFEWAAALTAAKALKDIKKIPFETINEPAISENACKIYREITEKGANSCKVR